MQGSDVKISTFSTTSFANSQVSFVISGDSLNISFIPLIVGGDECGVLYTSCL